MAVGGYMLGWSCFFVGDDADDPQVFETARGAVTRALQRASDDPDIQAGLRGGDKLELRQCSSAPPPAAGREAADLLIEDLQLLADQRGGHMLVTQDARVALSGEVQRMISQWAEEHDVHMDTWTVSSEVELWIEVSVGDDQVASISHEVWGEIDALDGTDATPEPAQVVEAEAREVPGWFAAKARSAPTDGPRFTWRRGPTQEISLELVDRDGKVHGLVSRQASNIFWQWELYGVSSGTAPYLCGAQSEVHNAATKLFLAARDANKTGSSGVDE